MLCANIGRVLQLPSCHQLLDRPSTDNCIQLVMPMTHDNNGKLAVAFTSVLQFCQSLVHKLRPLKVQWCQTSDS